ncbi:MAG: acetyl-CoA carboxylase biotin carboxylase subunit [Chitinophagales bacterium]
MEKVLVANRGEIALRIMRSLKEMNIKTVAVFSEVDRLSPHVKFADEAVCLGPPPSNQSYLLMDKIIATAKKLNVDGIHPGYGFLSENAEFSQKVKDAGIIFIGPSPESISAMGNKLTAKDAVKKFDIPLVPGTDHAIKDIPKAKKIAKDIGFPILIKAAAGGGGKGMRIVENAGEFESQMKLAVSEATSSFGDGSVFIEKFVTKPRHIEIQVLCDRHNNFLHLFERDCSIQRRHQKVIEEAPSAVLTPEIRQKMGQCAIDVARACNYEGAGTVEFLLDDQLNFYFLEMNTRLQVEHPVTELITGIDLVKEQVRIAKGEKLLYKQEDLKIQGHAIELRVYAEDPQNNFLPDIGKLKKYQRPLGPGVRVDDGFEQGMDIPIYYDPMISKLVTYGKDREEAIQRMIRAIEDYKIVGVKNTLAFGTYVMKHPAFVSGDFSTNFVKEHFDPKAMQVEDKAEAKIAALLSHRLLKEQKSKHELSENGRSLKKSRWSSRKF